MLYHIADAPAHGEGFNGGEVDDYKNGYKDDKPWEQLFKSMKQKHINYLLFSIDQSPVRMFNAFEKVYNSVEPKDDNLIFKREPLDNVHIVDAQASESNYETQKIHIRNFDDEVQQNEISTIPTIVNPYANYQPTLKNDEEVDKAKNSKASAKIVTKEDKFLKLTVENCMMQQKLNIASYNASKK